MKMSYNEAIRIQTAQISWYRNSVGRSGIKAIINGTKPCPPSIHPDEPIFVGEINELVPRGGSFEVYITGRGRAADNGDVRLAWHSAIMMGLL